MQHHYFKARAYRMKPLTEKGILSVDGENFPFTEFRVEVHPLMVSFLSPLGTYAAQFPSADYKPGNESG
jgi:sphingosine kinase